MTVFDRDPGAAALARLYDLDFLDDPGDVDLYLALAARTGGPILEIASGSCRVTLPLAEAGYEVTAVDIDTAMIDRARTLLAESDADVRARVTLVEADLVGLELPGGPRFALAILALNSILLLPSRELQRAALVTMARHLRPGGLAVVDTWLPSADELARYDGRLALEYVRDDPETGLVVTKVTSAQHEPATGHVDLIAMYEEAEQGGSSRRWVRNDRMLLLGALELRELAEAAGLEVEVVGGDYELNPVAGHDERAVLVARKPAAASRRKI
jgi:SAM-dependent methyltransferase